MDDRTVANELQNGSTQSSLACKTCRKRKLKCDRIVPRCQNCSKADSACEYPKVARKPGPRPGTHRRSAATTNGTNSARRMLPAPSSNGTRSNQASPDSSGLHNHPSDLSMDSASQSTPGDLFHHEHHSSLFGPTVALACTKMHISEKTCLKMVEAYFENMTSFILFHQPTFRNKLTVIESVKQTEALLTSMLAFAVRFMDSRDLVLGYDARPNIILERAYSLSQECLNECGDEVPPLHLLQSMLLQTLLLSSLGVRGRAYRLARQSISLAYELRLHELDLDINNKDSTQNNSSVEASYEWIAVEEKRRAWWATWECDVFASTIQRLPMTIDWTRNRTCLPSSDESWFEGQPARSCYLHIDPNKRWRNLRDTRNNSPTAWFILLNSYKWESLSVTQRIAPPTNFFDGEDKSDCVDPRPILLRKREMLENCLRCAVSAVPNDLQIDGLLTFDLIPGPYPSLRRTRDYGRYMVSVMSQVTQLLLSRKDLEGGNYIAFPADFNEQLDDRHHSSSQQQSHNHGRSLERKRWQQCLMASDKMAQIVRNSIPESYRYVSPNAATALWMAAAAQVAVLAFHRDEIDVDLAQSNLDLLVTTIESFIAFWDVPDTLVRSIAALKQHLGVLSSKQAEAAHALPTGRKSPATTRSVSDVQVSRDTAGFTPLDAVGKMAGMGDTGDFDLELSPFDILQAMDFGAMYNGVENWESLFLDPGFPATGLTY